MNIQTQISVLLSIYCKENPIYARECFDSLLTQTCPASEWVIVEDGPLTDDLYNLLDNYQRTYPNLIKRVKLQKNVGLGLALRNGLLHCSNELVARMDTDDIALSDRFAKQIAMFQQHPEIDICGGHIAEFEDVPENIVAHRFVPLTNPEIQKYQKRRDGLNHVTVMFKKSSVISAGNYQSCLLMEDTLLWANMFKNGCIAANIDEILVNVRIGKDMFERRGGYDYFKKYKEGRLKVYNTGFISWWDYIYSLIVQLFVCLLPNRLRAFVFTQILHKK